MDSDRETRELLRPQPGLQRLIEQRRNESPPVPWDRYDRFEKWKGGLARQLRIGSDQECP